MRVSGPSVTVALDGHEREVRITPQVPGGPAVAGDRVLLRVSSDEDATVVAVEPRTTVLERGEGAKGRARAIVANADLVIVVAAVVEPPLRARLVDRYLVAATLGGLDAAIVVTKTDLVHDPQELEATLQPFRALGHAVLSGCAKDAGFTDAIGRMIDGRTAILAGHSGVGKSTITAALTGVPRAVGAVSAKVRTGRHTTSDPRLIPLPGGGAVVDTAGVRTFHLPRMERRQLEQGFPEIARAAAGCRFRGCAHMGDAGCAVEGAVTPARIDSYRRMVEEIA